MDTVEEPIASSPSGESRTRTPAYASFESNIERLSHLFTFISRGGQHFVDEMKANVAPQIERLCTEIARLGRPQDKEANGQETGRGAHDAESALSDTRQRAEEIAKKLSDILEEPVKQFTGGLLTSAYTIVNRRRQFIRCGSDDRAGRPIEI
jgi:hypothetical protein